MRFPWRRKPELIYKVRFERRFDNPNIPLGVDPALAWIDFTIDGPEVTPIYDQLLTERSAL